MHAWIRRWARPPPRLSAAAGSSHRTLGVNCDGFRPSDSGSGCTHLPIVSNLGQPVDHHSQLEAVVGAAGRIRQVAADIVEHYETLRAIACELVETVRNNVTIDWTMRENVRAKLRSYVRRILRRHGYPPDKQEKATQTVLEQAEALSATWATAA